MRIESTFAPGQRAWCILNGCVERLTVGFVRVEVTDSPGFNGGRVDPSSEIEFDNYKPQRGFSETYMCVETGIGCGRMFTLGHSIFTSQTAAVAALTKEA